MNNNDINKPMSTREKLQYGSAFTVLIFGMALTTIGFFVPPLGDVSGSVIGIFGMALSYTGAVLGVSFYFSNKMITFERKSMEYIDHKLSE